MKHYYKSDFKLLLEMRNHRGEPIGVPSYDWTAKVYTSMPMHNVAASCKDGVYTNARISDDGSHVLLVCDQHGLSAGRVKVQFFGRIPDVDFPDGCYDFADVWLSDLWLTSDPSDGVIDDPDIVAKVEALFPFFKGEKGDKGDALTFDDLTPEQMAELKKPASEAAVRLDTFIEKASINETTRQSNEVTRQSEELSRQKEEAARVASEQERARLFSIWEDKISPNIPIEVESEDAMQALIDAGNAKDGHFYYIPEEEE